MNTSCKLSIFGELDKAIETACEGGDLKFSLSSSYGYNPFTNFLSLSFIHSIPDLESLVDFKRKNVGKITFDSRIKQLDEAIFYLDGVEYRTSARSVLLAAKAVLELVVPYECMAKVSIAGTNYFNEVGIPRIPNLKAPKTYHTDHELSRQWKEQIMRVR